MKKTTRQIWSCEKRKAPDCVLKVFRHVNLWKKFAFEKSRFGSFYYAITTYFAFFVLSRKAKFELQFLQRVRFRIEKKTTRQILNQKITTPHSLNGKNQWVKFWNKNFTTR